MTASDLNTPTSEPGTTDELTLLKERADLMGIKYHPSISLDTLKERVNSALNKTEVAPKDTGVAVVETETQLRARQIAEFTRLIRVRITCMDPNKKNWPGEYFTVSNGVIGTVKRFVPFNNTEGWHIEKIIYDHMKTVRRMEFKEIKGPRGMKIKKTVQVPAFAIEVLDPLTPAQLKDLAQKQALNHSIDSED